MSSYEYRKQYIAQKAVFVTPTNHVLILKSSVPNGDGISWDFPGGQMEPGETPLETLKREVKEEVGFEITNQDIRPLHNTASKGFGSMAEDTIIKSMYLVRVEDQFEPTLSHEHAEASWMHLSSLDVEKVNGFVRETLNKYMQLFPVPCADDRIKGFQGYGLVQLIHGHGKGKTTAALGQAVRASGAGKRVAIIYFDKGGTDHYFERIAIDTISGIDYWATGRDRIDPVTNAFDFSITQKDKEEAVRGLELAGSVLLADSEYDLVILDEINSTIDLGMLPVDSVLKLIQDKSKKIEVILTGRDPDAQLLESAHLVTEVKLARHYFYSGVKAREGLDF